MLKNLLFIHQSAELYGSDKTLLYLVKGVKESGKFNPIVVLPEKGPLKEALENEEIELIVSSVMKLSRSILKPVNLLKLPFDIVSATRELGKQLGGREIELVHSNTLAVLLGFFYAKRYGIYHIWHVHEIIRKPKLIQEIYRFLIASFSQKVVYNSKATSHFWSKKIRLKKKSTIILNGLDRTGEKATLDEQHEIRTKFFNALPQDKVIALIGRINHWKGQGLLVEAFKQLKIKHNNLKLIFIGSVYKGQESIEQNLINRIKEYSLEKDVVIVPFQSDIWKFWDSIDIAVVPSLEPEPFGLVAVEAMLAKKPVVASNHGGVAEIVVDGKTGLLFEPNNEHDLFEKLDEMLEDGVRMKEMGEHGFFIATEYFSLKNYVSNFLTLYEDSLS